MNKEEFHSIHVCLSESAGRKYVSIDHDLFPADRVYEYTTNDELKKLVSDYINNLFEEETNA